jgi:hypothetical protein
VKNSALNVAQTVPRVSFKSRLERSFIRTYECYLFVGFVTFGSIKTSRKEDEEEKRKKRANERETEFSRTKGTQARKNNQIKETLGEEEKKNVPASMLSVSLSSSLTSNSVGRERVRKRERT